MGATRVGVFFTHHHAKVQPCLTPPQATPPAVAATAPAMLAISPIAGQQVGVDIILWYCNTYYQCNRQGLADVAPVRLALKLC